MVFLSFGHCFGFRASDFEFLDRENRVFGQALFKDAPSPYRKMCIMHIFLCTFLFFSPREVSNLPQSLNDKLFLHSLLST